MKKFISIFLALALCFSVLSGCSGAKKADDGKLNIVTTIFPEYDWLKNITEGAQDVELTLLLDSGADLHSYQPTAGDIVKISDCDVFVYVGGESDQWVEEVLSGAVNKNMLVINLLDELGTKVKEEEIVEGMQSERGEKDESEYDEHVWLSLKNAATLCGRISDKLCEADEKNSAVYSKNTEEYLKKLSALDKEYRDARDIAKYTTLIFADRFPFRYLTDDYNLHYYAAFSGCSAESEASFETVAFLANKLDELKLPAVIKLDGSNGKLAETVIKASKDKNAETLELDSMQSITSEEIKNGKSYLDIMESNLAVLKKAIKE